MDKNEKLRELRIWAGSDRMHCRDVLNYCGYNMEKAKGMLRAGISSEKLKILTLEKDLKDLKERLESHLDSHNHMDDDWNTLA